MKSLSKNIKVVISVMGLIILLLCSVVGYLLVSNKVGNDSQLIKISSKETISNVDIEKSDLFLLFDYSGGIDLNTTSKEVSVYVDYYEKGLLKKHESVIEFQQDKEALKGRLVWGVNKDSSTLSVAFHSSEGVGMSNSIEAFWLDTNNNWMSGSSASDGKNKEINKNEKYLIYKWVENENNSMSAYIEDEEEFSQKRIVENDKLIQLYVEFK